MVLTDTVYPGRGFARLLLEHTLDALVARDVWGAKLDATETGEPLDRRVGFSAEIAVECWERVGGDADQLGHGPMGDSRQAGRTLDVRAFGGDRSALIEILAQVGAAGVRDEGHLRFRIRLGNVRH